MSTSVIHTLENTRQAKLLTGYMTLLKHWRKGSFTFLYVYTEVNEGSFTRSGKPPEVRSLPEQLNETLLP